ncbi:LAFA_0D11474g1_1 [Lachancea sp. 'fantastica']|nr:LAFA_0D11474g1_1 [Lachancea sp. 'fantastica']
MVDVLEIPGFYYDTERKRYFKVSENALSSSNQAYGRDEIKKKSDEQRSETERIAASEIRRNGIRNYELSVSDPVHMLFSTDNCDLFEMQSRTGYNVARQFQQQNEGIIRKDNVWSDVTPTLGSAAQVAVAICCLPKTNGFLVVTHRMNVVYMREGQVPIYLSQSPSTDVFELDSLKMHSGNGQLCLLMKIKEKNCYSLFNVQLNSSDVPQIFSISICPELNSEIRDALFVGANTCVWVAQGNEILALDVQEGRSTYRLSTSKGRAKRRSRERSDVMCVEFASSRSLSNNSPPMGWSGTRNGTFSKICPYPTFSTLNSNSVGAFEGLSILTIKELDESHLLLSGVESEEQVLAIISKNTSNDRGHQPPILALLKTRVRNLVKETEIMSVSADGRFILYGRRNIDSVHGALELFSTTASDNFVRQQEPKGGPVIFHPIKTLAEFLPIDWHNSFRKLLHAELHEPKTGEFYYGNLVEADEIRVASFTNDTDVAGINFKSFPLVEY